MIDRAFFLSTRPALRHPNGADAAEFLAAAAAARSLTGMYFLGILLAMLVAAARLFNFRGTFFGGHSAIFLAQLNSF